MQITGATTDPAARPTWLHCGPPDARSSPPRQVRGWPGPGQGRRPDPEPQPTAHGTIVRLRDGSVVLIRQLQATDATLLAGIFTRLSPASRWMRFLAAKNHLTEAELRYLTNIDHHDHEALTALDHPGWQGVGVARYIRHPGDPRAAEIAITVIDDWHRRGLGTQLVTQLADRARHAGITRFTALASADNAAISGLLAGMIIEGQFISSLPVLGPAVVFGGRCEGDLVFDGAGLVADDFGADAAQQPADRRVVG